MTMEDIRNVTFERVGRHGYQADEVDVFLKEVMDYVQKLQKDLEDSQQKMKVLAAKVEEYRNDEESIRGSSVGRPEAGQKRSGTSQRQGGADCYQGFSGSGGSGSQQRSVGSSQLEKRSGNLRQ